MKMKSYYNQNDKNQFKKLNWHQPKNQQSLPTVNGNEIYVRYVDYQPKKMIEFQKPQTLQFWGLVNSIHTPSRQSKSPIKPNIIKHKFNRSQILLAKYMNRKQSKSNQKIQVPTEITMSKISSAKTSRTSFSVKKRKLSTRLPSTSMSENQLSTTQEFFKKFDQKDEQNDNIDLFSGIAKIINMKNQKKYEKVAQKKFKKFRKYSQDQAVKNIWNEQQGQEF